MGVRGRVNCEEKKKEAESLVSWVPMHVLTIGSTFFCPLLLPIVPQVIGSPQPPPPTPLFPASPLSGWRPPSATQSDACLHRRVSARTGGPNISRERRFGPHLSLGERSRVWR